MSEGAEGHEKPQLQGRIMEIAMSAPEARYIPSNINPENIPENLDLSSFPEGYAREDTEQLLNFARDYVQYHIYTNEFPTHGQRAQWEEEQLKNITDEYGNEATIQFNQFISRQNKIPRGVVGNFEPLSVFLEMDGVYDKFPPQLQQIRDIIGEKVATHDVEVENPETGVPTTQTVDPWQKATTDEKIETVNNISNLAVGLLNHFKVEG